MSNNTVSRNKLLEYKIKSKEFKNEFEKLTTRRPAVPENIVQEMYTMGKSALERIYTKLNETDSITNGITSIDSHQYLSYFK